MANETHPYRDLPDYCFWSRSMSLPAPGQIDPVVGGVRLQAEDRVGTMGSCFAQHLSRPLQSRGFNYYVAEQAEASLNEDEARKCGYGVFSARYGNVYTVRQAVQLFDRALGHFQPTDDVWKRGEGYVDAFRPQIEAEPLVSPEAVRASAKAHLGHVRDVFLNSNWLVFTLGLTEAWRSRVDGAVYPVAPGVTAGAFDRERYEFVNFNVDEVRADLKTFIEKIVSVNPGIRIFLTVSPVPLIATQERQHVLVSTTYSKSVLRVAAEEASRSFENVIYFPSYEIITSPAAGGRYYKDDLREVTEVGVKHVMRIFERHYLSPQESAAIQTAAAATTPTSNEASVEPEGWNVICDEEVIEQALRASGVSKAEHMP